MPMISQMIMNGSGALFVLLEEEVVKVVVKLPLKEVGEALDSASVAPS